MERFYRGRTDWIDGTAQFHEICRGAIPKGARVLEIGAGPTNKTTKFLAGIAGSLTGLDIDEAVRGNADLREAVVYDGAAIPFADGSFDVVVMNYVTEHLPDPGGLSREIGRVLSYGGALVFRAPNRFHYVSLAARLTPHWFHKLAANRLRSLPADADDPHPTYYRLNSAADARRILAHAGLETTRIDLVEKEPSYGMSSRVLFLLFLVYERLVNATDLLACLRANIFVVARKTRAAVQEAASS